jgi:hypothetical protein
LRPKALIIVVGLLIVPVARAAGQQRTQPSPTPASLPLIKGSRVRVHSTALVAPLVANYLELRGDTLVFFEEGAGRGIWSLSLEQVQRLEVSIGTRNMYQPYIVSGALVGAGAGAVGGLLFAATFSPSDPSRQYNRLLTGSLGALVGAGIGGVIGSRRKAEQFSVIRVPRRVSALPNGRGGLVLSIGY